MRKIKLLKDHETPRGNFKAGETIDVDKATYDWLMSVYLQDRKELVAHLDTVPSFMKETND